MRLVKARPLRPEVALSGFGADDNEEVAGRDERQARKRLRKRSKAEMDALKARQKLKKYGGGRSGKRRGRDGGEAPEPPARRSPPFVPPRVRQQRRQQAREADHLDVSPEDIEDLEDFEDEIEEEMLEGTRLELGREVQRGRLSPNLARKLMDRVRSRVQDGRERRQERRGGPAPASAPAAAMSIPAAPADGWNPPGLMGRNLRVQARLNHRAAVMELRPGLYLVADVASEALLPSTSGDDIGMVLPSLMVKAASKVLQNRRERRGALDALQPRQLPGPAPAASPSPFQLYGMEWSEG